MRHWLLIAWIAWVAVALLALAITTASTPLLFEQYGTLCFRAAASCLELSQLTPEGLREVEQVGISLGIYAGLTAGVGVLSKLVWMAVGALVFLLRSGDRMALLVAFFLVSFGTATFSTESVDVLVSAHSAWWLPARGLQVLGEVFAVLFFLTFPDSRFVPRWTPLLGVAFLAFQIPSDLVPDIYSGSPALELARVWCSCASFSAWSVPRSTVTVTSRGRISAGRRSGLSSERRSPSPCCWRYWHLYFSSCRGWRRPRPSCCS